MHKGTKISAIVCAAATVVSMAGCGANGGDAAEETFDPNVKTTISVSGWTLEATPEFNALAEAFMKKHPNVTVDMRNYQAGDDYETQLTADLSSGTEPNVIAMRTLSKYASYADSGQLADLSDVAKSFEAEGDNLDVSAYELDGKYYSIPYRINPYVLFYNKTAFDKAGVAIPDGTWTWDDYIETARELKRKLPAAGYDGVSVYPTYTHYWNEIVQGFAYAQTDGADYYSGDYDFMKPYYETFLKLQDEGLTLNFSSATATKASYQSQFCAELSIMYPIGTWAVATLIQNQKSGDAHQFEWGIAPLPQDSSDDTKSGSYRTAGQVTGFAMSNKTSGQVRAAAKEFIKFAAGEEGALAVAATGTQPAYRSDKVTEAYFSLDGMPQDELSKQAWGDQKVYFAPPANKNAAELVSMLNTMHSSIMTETKSVDEAVAATSEQIKSQGILK